MYHIIQKRRIWFSISGLIIILSILALIFWGLNLSIDFTGGSIIELNFFNQRPDQPTLENALATLELGTLNIQPADENGILIRTIPLAEEKHQALLLKIEQLTHPQATNKGVQVKPEILGLKGEGVEGLSITTSGGKDAENIPQELRLEQKKYSSFEELRFDSIGPIIGTELKRKAIYSIIIVLLAIIAYIAYAFRKVAYPVESWKYGLSAIIALAHDILIITGIFAVLGRWLNIQIDSYFVTALLTVLGFSVHDTIVTFDRARENIRRHQDKTFEEIVNLSVNETLIRSINTSLTTFLALAAVFLFGGLTIKYFVLALMLGLLIGTYSSIFLASPLLIIFYKLKRR